MENKLFYRDGREFTGTPELDEKGKPFITRVPLCGRCGGKGGGDQWKFTGWTCYACGGSKYGAAVRDRLYTQEKIGKMNAAAAKRAEKKAAEKAERARLLEAGRAAEREGFAARNKEYFDNAIAVCGETGFVAEIIATAKHLANLTENQRAAIDKAVAETQRKAAAQYVGEIGERRTFNCTMQKVLVWQNTFGYRTVTSYCQIMRDENGNTIKYVGTTILGGFHFEGDRDYRYPVMDAEVIQFAATVKEHEDYKGDKQTVVARPKVKEVAE